MRIAFTSDLHTDLGGANAALVPRLVERATALRPDVLLVAGDVADRAVVVAQTLEAFRGVATLRLFVPGNHDLYAELDATGITDSRTKFERVLPATAERAGFAYLGCDAVHWRGRTFVGTPGWWDYSLRDRGLDPFVGLEQYRAGTWRNRRAFDRGSILWPKTTLAASPAGSQPAASPGAWASDEEICEHMLHLLDGQLRDAPHKSPIVAAVHVLPCLEAVQRHAFGPSAFHDATLGSVRFGEHLRADARVRVIVTGHLHRPVDTRLGSIAVVSRPVGRLREPGIDLAARAATCLGVLELD